MSWAIFPSMYKYKFSTLKFKGRPLGQAKPSQSKPSSKEFVAATAVVAVTAITTAKVAQQQQQPYYKEFLDLDLYRVKSASKVTPRARRWGTLSRLQPRIGLPPPLLCTTYRHIKSAALVFLRVQKCKSCPWQALREYGIEIET